MTEPYSHVAQYLFRDVMTILSSSHAVFLSVLGELYLEMQQIETLKCNYLHSSQLNTFTFLLFFPEAPTPFDPPPAPPGKSFELFSRYSRLGREGFRDALGIIRPCCRSITRDSSSQSNRSCVNVALSNAATSNGIRCSMIIRRRKSSVASVKFSPMRRNTCSLASFTSGVTRI